MMRLLGILWMFFISIQLSHGDEQSEIQWLSGPGVQCQVLGDNVTLTWLYEVNSNYSITYIRMTDTERIENRHTVAMYDIANNRTVVYLEQFENRISFEIATQQQTSILVCNISQVDAGSYFLILDGPGEKNQIQLLVFEEKELEPSLTIQNKPQTFGECFDLKVGDECLLILTPGSGLPANISIFAEDTLVEFCPMATMAHPCGYSLNTSTPSNQNLTFVFNYGACQPIERMITAVVAGPVDSGAPQRPACSGHSKKWMTIAVVALVCLGAGVICAIGLAIWWKKCRSRPTSPRVTTLAQKPEDAEEELVAVDNDPLMLNVMLNANDVID